MKTQSAYFFGWKFNKLQSQAVIKKKSQVDFLISIIMAFFVIIVISQLLTHLDKAIRNPFIDEKISLLNPLAINRVSAASEEAIKMVQSQKDLTVTKNEAFDFTVGYKNVGNK